MDVDAIESILNKLNEKEQERLTITLEKLRSIVIYSADEVRNIRIDKKDLQNKFILINKAIKNSDEIVFNFHNKMRRFVPQSFTYYKDYIYITGYSILENDIKTLNLSGIKNLEYK